MSEEGKKENADWLIQAAQQLRAVGEPDKAETCYRKALEWTPDDQAMARDLATFLYRSQAKYGEAEEMLRKCVERSQSAEDMARLAGLLLCLGKNDEGIDFLHKTLANANLESESPAAALEALFYAVLHMPAEEQKPAYERLKNLVQSGAKAPGLDIMANLNRARADDHKGIGQLQQLLNLVAATE
ncbi:MAG: hypothetical protein HQL53_06820 [Magnetococcales bacterium]|nr:hypothetical protein [Magnetococcales bacterium]